MRGDDLPPAEGGTPDTLVSVTYSRFVTFAGMLAATNNRYFNTILYDVHRSSDILLEDCEGHDFHRVAFNAWYSDRVTYRRCYADAGSRADLPDCVSPAEPDLPFCSGVPEAGDTAFDLYQTVSEIRFENCVASGPFAAAFSVGLAARDISILGSIVLGNPV